MQKNTRIDIVPKVFDSRYVNPVDEVMVALVPLANPYELFVENPMEQLVK